MKKEYVRLGLIAAVVILILWWINRGGSAAVLAQPPNYTNYNQVPDGTSPLDITLAGLPGLNMPTGAPSCGCSNSAGYGNQLFASAQSLISYYQGVVNDFAAKAYANLVSAGGTIING